MNDGGTIVGILKERVRVGGGRPLIKRGDRWFGYDEMWDRVCRGRAFFLSHRAKPGDRVLIDTSVEGPEFVAAYFAAHLAELIAVPFGVSGETAKKRLRKAAEPAFELDRQTIEDALDAPGVPVDHDPPLPSARSIADIIFTSGTTGQPKGVMLDHAGIYAATRSITTFIGNGPDDREVVTIPLSHSFGLGRVRSVIMAGGSLDTVPGLSFPAKTLEALADPLVTGLSCVPTGIAILWRWGEEEMAATGRKLRYIELGSAFMSAARKKALAELLPETRICMHYGLTEASRSCFLDFFMDAGRLATVGRPSEGVALRIVDADDMPLGVGEEGLIQIRSAAAMVGYWRNPEATAKARTEDGWLHTGDVGSLDAEGYLTLVGRGDDQINVGGKKVDPEAIEEIARALDGVKDAACVGIPDPGDLLGQVPVLFIVGGDHPPDPKVLRRHLLGHLEPHERPLRIIETETLPRTDTGKLKRAELRRRLVPE